MTPAEIDALVAGLTGAQAEAVKLLSGDWEAGPNLPDAVLDGDLAALRAAGLVERHFGDMHEGRMSASGDGLLIRLSSCWWFRLSKTGLAVRQRILAGEG